MSFVCRVSVSEQTRGKIAQDLPVFNRCRVFLYLFFRGAAHSAFLFGSVAEKFTRQRRFQRSCGTGCLCFDFEYDRFEIKAKATGSATPLEATLTREFFSN